VNGYKIVSISACLFMKESSSSVHQLVYHRAFVHATNVKRYVLIASLTANVAPASGE
jgi:hypothetical protein